MKPTNSAPLSQSQLGIFSECMQNPEKNLYLISILYKISKDIDLERLRDAIVKAADVHPTFYTRIRLNDEGVAEQYTDKTTPLDIRIDAVADIEAEKPQLRQPIALIGGPLLRFRLLETPDAKYINLQCHHIIADGFSVTVLLQDIDRIYRGEPTDEEALTMADIALAEAEARNGEEWKKDEAWFQEHFACDDVDTTLPPDLEGKDAQLEVIELPVRINPADVKRFCAETGFKPSVFFTAAYALLFARYTGDEQVLFSTIWHGRSNEQLARSFGMFVTTMPCLFHFSDEMTVADLLAQGSVCVTEARKHPHYSFADFCNAQGVQPQLLFSYQGNLFQQLSLDNHPVVSELLNNDDTNAPITAMVFEHHDNYSMRLSYHANRYSSLLMEQLIKSYETIAAQMLCAEKPLRDITPTAVEQLQLLDSFNQTDVPYDDTQTIVSLFQQ
ncbi:MAG: hypothetical protein IKH48_03790, partial [Prevotella sp.]|nr:hypothetical protein [Prevotella sp.]